MAVLRERTHTPILWELSPGTACNCLFSEVYSDLLAWLSCCNHVSVRALISQQEQHLGLLAPILLPHLKATVLKGQKAVEPHHKPCSKEPFAPAGAASGPESSFADGSGLQL